MFAYRAILLFLNLFVQKNNDNVNQPFLNTYYVRNYTMHLACVNLFNPHSNTK